MNSGADWKSRREIPGTGKRGKFGENFDPSQMRAAASARVSSWWSCARARAPVVDSGEELAESSRA